jgi:hypothetical protein
MNKKLKIFSFPDRNPEYIQLQIDSYNKYLKSDQTELILINASLQHEDEINQICKNNHVECIRFGGQREGPFDSYYVRQFHWFRDTLQKDINDNIMLIHSDMFFINKFDYHSILDKYEICYNPQYRNKFTGNPYVDYKYVWDGIILFNSQYFNENKLTSLFNWDYIRPITDMGGMMKEFLKEVLPRKVHTYFEFWNYREIKGSVMDTHLNGNIRYYIDMNSKKFINQPNLGNRSFDYEIERENYQNFYIKQFEKMKEFFIDPFEWPIPENIDVIQTFEEDILKSFVLHFKSGSGYDASHNQIYKNKKIKEIAKMIERDLK